MWACGGCGAGLDRDVNAAVSVIKAAGLAVSALWSAGKTESRSGTAQRSWNPLDTGACCCPPGRCHASTSSARSRRTRRRGRWNPGW
nr:hypothetical protein [Streptomyces sp. SAI-041]